MECRFHDLRHTTCTRLLERAAPFAAVAAIMGWSPGTAMRMANRYAHIGKSIQREAVALLDPPSPQPSQPAAQQSSAHGATLVTGPTTVQ